MVIPQLQSGGCRDVITPHKVAVSILILEYYKKDPDTVWLPKYRKKFGLLLLRLIQNADLSFRDLNHLIKSDAFCLHPQHIAQFEGYLERLVSADQEMLHDFPQALDKLVNPSAEETLSSSTKGVAAAPVVVNDSSIVGLYLRRFILGMSRMSLLEEGALFHAICEYRRKGVRALSVSKDNDNDVHCYYSTEANDPQQAMGHEGRDFRRWNRKQIELFVGQQFRKLEYHEAEALPPKLLQATIDEIIEDNPGYSPAYFLDYLNSLRCGDVSSCVEKLHRCFDVNEQRGVSGKPGKGYQYYVLNLAMLHARFTGHRQLALGCLRESVMLAQEVGDRECIELAENWRQFLGNANWPTGVNRVGVDHLPSTFQSINNQLVAKASAIQGTSARHALQIVSGETGYVNHNNSLLVAASLSLKSAIYVALGQHAVAGLHSQLLLNSPLKTYGNTLNGEPQCKSLLNVAVCLSANGHYDQAKVLFQLAGDTHQSAPLRKDIASAELQVSLAQYLTRKEWEKASGVCQRMDTYDGWAKGMGLVRLHVERGDFPTATAIVDQLLNRRRVSALTRTQLCILKLTVMLSVASPNYEFMNLAVKALNYAREHNLAYEVARIEVLIARIQLQLEMPTMAKATIERALVKILADGSLLDQGDALWEYLKCRLLCEEEGQAVHQIVQLLTVDSGAGGLLDVIVRIYTKLECTGKLKQVFRFLAELCHELGLREERNRFAFRFKQVVLENASVIE